MAWRVLLFTYLMVGSLVWLTAGGTEYHIGASGVVYGLAFFLLGSGIFRKDRESVAIALIVTFLYGGLIWGILPVQSGVSWESHLYGAIVGFTIAFFYRNEGVRRDLSMEDLDDEDYFDDRPFFEILEESKQIHKAQLKNRIKEDDDDSELKQSI